MKWQVLDLGLMPYLEVLDIQERYFQQNLNAKESGLATSNTLILCEHPNVYTLGKSGKIENLLLNPSDVKAEFYTTNRGGDITFHGPGQLVVYPIFDLETFKIGLAEYIFRLEQVIINLLKEYDINGSRIEGAAGIWLHSNTYFPEKICAIGVKASRNVTMHGIAVNVNTNLSYFNHIVPCGIANKGVTSLSREMNRFVDMDLFKLNFLEAMGSSF